MTIATRITRQTPRNEIVLPEPRIGGGMSLTGALTQRRSRREFGAAPLSLAQLGQLCWAAQGITEGKAGLRTAPSGGAISPITVFAADDEGVYRYDPSGHRLCLHLVGAVRARLRAAALDQPCVGEAPLCLVLTLKLTATAAQYGRRRAWRYALLEAGHVAQNVLLQATALGLAGVPVGAFDDQQVAEGVGLPLGLHAVYLLPLGPPAGP